MVDDKGLRLQELTKFALDGIAHRQVENVDEATCQLMVVDRAMEVGGDRADSRDRGMPSVRNGHYSLCHDSATLQG
jgi:hypothetical protein